MPFLIGSQIVYTFLKERPNEVFDIPALTDSVNSQYKTNLSNIRVSTILSRLFHDGKIIRSPTQSRKSYLYSVSNKNKIKELYEDYLVPSELDNKDLIKKRILKSNFKGLSDKTKLNLDFLSDFAFFRKYGQRHFEDMETQIGFAKIVAFVIGDGNIYKNSCTFLFKEKKDAKLFIKDVKRMFPYENPFLQKREFCYAAKLNNKELVGILIYLGAPSGKKVFQPFLVPDWILNGPDEIKRGFLSTIYGNEGSKPQDNRWRIQFVLSKNKRFVCNLLDFQNQIRSLLAHFGIKTSFIQLRRQEGREYNGRFYIKSKGDLRKFYKEFEFLYASEKQVVLKNLILGSSPKEVQNAR